jgi:hypothetical protein
MCRDEKGGRLISPSSSSSLEDLDLVGGILPRSFTAWHLAPRVLS